MDITTTFGDPEREQAGVWIDYRDGSRVKIARLHNPRFRREYDRLMEPYRAMERRGVLPSEVETKKLCEAMARTIVLGWEGFTRNGQPLRYSVDEAYDLLLTHLTFRNEMTALAAQESFFMDQSVEDAAGNFDSASTGNSATASE